MISKTDFGQKNKYFSELFKVVVGICLENCKRYAFTALGEDFHLPTLRQLHEKR